jgi:hypothetical protein
MEWWQIIVLLLLVYAAYSVGHWVGYGKGEQDTKELTEEIRKLNKKRARYLRWNIKAQSYKAKSLQKTLDAEINAKPANRWSERVTYKTASRR